MVALADNENRGLTHANSRVCGNVPFLKSEKVPRLRIVSAFGDANTDLDYDAPLLSPTKQVLNAEH